MMFGENDLSLIILLFLFQNQWWHKYQRHPIGLIMYKTGPSLSFWWSKVWNAREMLRLSFVLPVGKVENRFWFLWNRLSSCSYTLALLQLWHSTLVKIKAHQDLGVLYSAWWWKSDTEIIGLLGELEAQHLEIDFTWCEYSVYKDGWKCYLCEDL